MAARGAKSAAQGDLLPLQAPPSVAVILPCYNEEAAIGTTVAAFRSALPGAKVYVYDNNSSDRTVDFARAAGAIVRTERMQGKGHVVRRMFADVEADIYVMADGDATYDASAAPAMVRMLVDERLDMVVGARESEVKAAYRPGHRFGNAMLTGILTRIFGRSFSDILSGYRIFSRRFVKSFPVLSTGFEIETEICINAVRAGLKVAEVASHESHRRFGESNLNTFRDGWRVLKTMFRLRFAGKLNVPETERYPHEVLVTGPHRLPVAQ